MGRPVISQKDVLERFIHSSGPGGQNVNKVATCVQLVHKPTGVIVKCHHHRTQASNRQEAWDKLRKALQERNQRKLLEVRQAFEKQRRQNRKRSKAAKERILQDKKRRSIKKMFRKGALLDD